LLARSLSLMNVILILSRLVCGIAYRWIIVAGLDRIESGVSLAWIVADCVAGLARMIGAGLVASNSMRESGAILAEIRLCYLVGDWRDFTA
jgi:hypothetical protein